MNCKIHSTAKSSLIYNNNFQLLNISGIEYIIIYKNAAVVYFFCFKNKNKFLFEIYYMVLFSWWKISVKIICLVYTRFQVNSLNFHFSFVFESLAQTFN